MYGEYYEPYLAHHGVKGMKWGVRRTPEQLGHKPTGNEKELSLPDGRKVTVRPMTKERMTYFDSLEFKNKTTDTALIDRINKLGTDWEKQSGKKIKEVAAEICRDVTMTRKPSDRHKFLEHLSATLDSSVYDDPSVMAVDKQTGRMRYNSCVKFDFHDIHVDSQTGLYNTRELDNVLGEKSGSMYYYYQGYLQNQTK